MYYTNNYGLRLPQRSQGEKANVDDLNYNAEKIDGLTHGNRTMLAVPWDAETDWMKGNFVVKTNNSTLEADYYECKEDHTTGAWDASKWEHRTIGEVLEILAQGAGGATSLDELDDVEITSPTEGQILRRDANGDWVNTDMPDVSVTKAVEGNPVEFTDGANAPLVKCVSAITGSQDLHGYDKPWVGGAGKNKLPLVLSDIKSANTGGTWSGNAYTINDVTFTVLTDNYGNVTGINATGNSSSTSTLYINYDASLVGTQVTVNGCPSGGSPSTYWIQVNGLGYDTGSGVTGELPGATVQVRVGQNQSAVNITFYPMIRLSTESDSTFAPYSNICPISGYSEVGIEVRGKNLLNPTEISQPSGNNIVWGYYDNGILLKAGYTYTLSISTDISSISFYATDHTTQLAHASTAGVRSVSYTPANDIHACLRVYKNTGLTVNTVKSSWMLERGSTATTYEPYTSTTHTTTFPSAIYRGSEDVVNGEVTEEWVKVVFDGSNDELWYLDGSRFYIDDSSLGAKPHSVAISNQYENHVVDYWSALQNGEFSIHPSAGNIISFVNTNISSVSDWRTYLASNNLEVAYQLQTTTTSPVTPTNLPIKSLYGYNHIESSTGGMEIEYITQGEQAIVDLVEANPSETPTEVLSAIKINGVVYSLPSGGGGIESLSRSYSQISIS